MMDIDLNLDEPYELYSRSIAVPLHKNEDFRELGLKRLLCMLGAQEVEAEGLLHLSQAIFKSTRSM